MFDEMAMWDYSLEMFVSIGSTENSRDQFKVQLKSDIPEPEVEDDMTKRTLASAQENCSRAANDKKWSEHVAGVRCKINAAQDEQQLS